MITPIGANLFVRLDPVVMKAGRFFLPDQKFIRICDRCHQRAEALTDHPVCPASRDDFGYDAYHDRPTFIGVDTRHAIVSITAPVIPSMSRFGTVLARGTRATLPEGARVVVDYTAGGTLDDLRIIPEESVLALVEEE